MQTNIIPRKTVEQIVEQRNACIVQMEKASSLLEEAFSIAESALGEVHGISTGSDFNYDRKRIEQSYNQLFRNGYDAESSIKTAREIIDYDIWLYLMDYTNIKTLMDKEAKDELLSSLKEDVPEVTVDNVYATLEHLYENSYTIFLRGIANVFSNLDRRFRSHSAWKLGSRVIITNAFDEYGFWNHWRNHQATLIDIERVFSQLDTGKQTNTLVASIDEARKGWGAKQTFLESDYFKIRVFKNGNCHIWFKRDDLVLKVNKLIAEYYGDVIPDDTEEVKEEEIFKDYKTSLAKNYGFFPTPNELVKTLFDQIYINDDREYTLLEPSAGTGHISKHAVELGLKTDVIEIQENLVKGLKESGLYEKVYMMDFHKFDSSKQYDFIIMNPPFDRGRDIDHIMKAWKFLKKGGTLVSIMHSGIEFSQTKKAKAFRKFAKENTPKYWGSVDGLFKDLPKNSFASVGTNVNTVMCKLIK